MGTHTIRKVKFLSKNSSLTKLHHFHEFFTKKVLTIFLVKSKLSTAKKSKTATFSRFFHPKKIDNFLGKSKLNYWTKNGDLEQCDSVVIHNFHGSNKGCLSDDDSWIGSISISIADSFSFMLVSCCVGAVSSSKDGHF